MSERPLRLLMVEDSPSDSDLLLRHLEKEGLKVEGRRVETRDELVAALAEGEWDLVVSDYGLPSFSGLEAIATATAFDPDLPVLLVSGTVGEETAAEVMRAGARDFMLKGSLARLAMAIQREVKEAESRRGLRQLEASMRLKDRLISMGTIAAGVAHEINNPLTHLVASLPMVLEGVKKRPAEDDLQELVEGCIEGANRIAAIVRDLKVFSRPDESTADCEVSGVLTSVLSLLNLEYRHATRIERDVPEGLRVAAPPARLAQVLTNLVINAVQSMPSRPKAENLIQVTARVDGSSVILAVKDNGLGMSEAVRARLFVPFFTTKPVGEGTGLGLTVSRGIVQGLHGSIEVASTEGVGSTFTVRLPWAKPVVSSPPPAPAPEAGRPLRLLLVDDEALLRRVTRRVLQPHEVVEASNAEEGLAILGRDQRFDVILCDLMMPGRSGKDFYSEVIARQPRFTDRFLFVSGGAVTDETDAFLAEINPERVVLKPFTASELHSAVQRVGASPP